MADNEQIQEHIASINYPATKQEIIEQLQQREADESVLSTLRMLPERRFNSSTEVSQAVSAVL